jgi:glycosyltransferase involved in cell wall biosynthesis
MSLPIQHEPMALAASPGPRRLLPLEHLRVAIVHYWLISRRGGERVVESLAKMFPAADLFTLVVDREKLSPLLRRRSIHTSLAQKFPASTRSYRHLLPIYPLLLEQFDLSGYDLVLSSESGPAKGVLTASHTCHICYCHSPMRYLWDFYHGYRSGKTMGTVSRAVFGLASHYLRMWDAASANRVDYFVANSGTVAARIRKHYRREATVIHPPVDVRPGYLSSRIDDYYLFVGQLVDYKRADLAIEACNRLGRKLRIVGDGEQYARLQRMAGPTISFCGSLSDDGVREQYAHCRALLFPGEEDFGMVPVEAMSFGRPVIAYGRGGATETVNGFDPDRSEPASASGIFFREQTTESLIEAILAYEGVENRFSPFRIRQGVQRFDESHFVERIGDFIGDKVAQFQAGGP